MGVSVKMTDHSGIITRKVRVTGRVQGVGYRAWTQNRAIGLDLSGWVRNEADGSVTALLQGPSASIEKLCAKMKKGPSGSLVRKVEIEPAETDIRRPGFIIMHQARS